MPIDPTMLAGGPEWAVGGVDGLAGGAKEAAGSAPAGFGAMLGNEVTRLTELQTEAADAALGVATGTAPDASAAVMAVERARLSMQLAAQIRTKSVDAIQDIFHTQI